MFTATMTTSFSRSLVVALYCQFSEDLPQERRLAARILLLGRKDVLVICWKWLWVRREDELERLLFYVVSILLFYYMVEE